MNSLWHSKIDVIAATMPLSIQRWVQEPFILSKTLKKTCNSLKVKLLSQQPNELLQDEQQQFNIAVGDNPVVRQVFLEADGMPQVYARTVIPQQTYINAGEDFSKLGEKLIGETVLYKDSQLQRAQFEYACIDKQQPLHQAALINLPAKLQNETAIFARRSLFSISYGELLITELFFNHIAPYPEM